jgi:hypothetical protein
VALFGFNDKIFKGPTFALKITKCIPKAAFGPEKHTESRL